MRHRSWTNEQLINAVKSSYSYRQTLLALNLKGAGGNYKHVREVITELKLDTSHWTGQAHLKGKSCSWSPKKMYSEILIENSSYSSTHSLKHRLIKDGLLIDRCSRCDVTHWLEEKLSLHLDHINGIRTDNRIENLRLLCPNCHSLTETYAGKNKKKSPILVTRPVKLCKACNTVAVASRNIYCEPCRKITHHQKTKINWPSKVELQLLVESTSMKDVAKKLGVSTTSLRCRL